MPKVNSRAMLEVTSGGVRLFEPRQVSPLGKGVEGNSVLTITYDIFYDELRDAKGPVGGL